MYARAHHLPRGRANHNSHVRAVSCALIGKFCSPSGVKSCLPSDFTLGGDAGLQQIVRRVPQPLDVVNAHRMDAYDLPEGKQAFSVAFVRRACRPKRGATFESVFSTRSRSELVGCCANVCAYEKSVEISSAASK
jgi:hypothetical protein